MTDEKASKYNISINSFTGALGDNAQYNQNVPSPSQPPAPTSPPPAAGKPGVFISYSRTDEKAYVALLIQRLRNANIPIWWDRTDIEIGANWRDELNQGLQKSTCMILCLSPDAIASTVVKEEYRYFLSHNKKIFPLLCRDTELPSELLSIQYSLYSDMDRLIEQVKAYLQG